jgi:Type I restriction modification DNA specificity domain
MKRLDEIFDVYYGNQFDLNKMTISESSDINFVSRSGNNLGVVSKVDRFNEVQPFQPGQITVALGGSILSSFVQISQFYTGQNIKILKPKTHMSFETLVYYALCIEKNKFRYSSHGREANVTLDSLLVPDMEDLNNVSTVNIEKIVNEVQKPKIELNYELQNSKYRDFFISEIFDVSGTKTTSIHKLKEYGKGEYPYITTSSKACGINGFFNFYTEESHVLTIESAVNGVCYYQDKKFSASDHVEKLTPKFQVSKEFMIYISVLVNRQNFRFNYGRKANQERIKKIVISLPITDNGNINFEYINSFMGSLKFSSTIF